ncbi:hypothetical protein SAMN05216411_10849 [Nitrosospira multiformis]|nr:hypothetical protein SAMN05216411_10849 [Nitrosospira multiformis]
MRGNLENSMGKRQPVLRGQNLLGKTLTVISAKAEIRWLVITLKRSEDTLLRG